jgi:hypothetical protein
VFVPVDKLIATNGEPRGVAREPEIHERMMRAYAEAGDFCGALQTFLDAPLGSYDVGEFQVLLHHAFGNGYFKLRNQSKKAEELSVRRKYARILCKGLKDLAARYRTADPDISSTGYGKKTDPVAEKLRKVEHADRVFREWSRDLLSGAACREVRTPDGRNALADVVISRTS